jgi:UDP-N-acetylmuramate--alanine ligase
VQGTDANPGGAAALRALGIAVSAHDPALVSGARAVVFSSAIPAAHPELQAARAAGLPLVRRAEALAAAVAGGPLVGIAGTHGKTTTTVMTTEALAAAGVDPTGVVGGRVTAWGGNLRLGGPCAVVEADEYDRSFLALTPSVAVVLNVEADHLDIYRDLADIAGAFTQFLAPARTVVRCADDPGAMALPLGAGQEELAYSATAPGDVPAPGAVHARLVAQELVLDAAGARWMTTLDGRPCGEVRLAVPGLHNVRNALAALGAGIALGQSVPALAQGLARFTGVERRFQRLGEARGVLVVDDYAHHPTEVRATLAAARHACPGRRLVVVFQPHLYSRTRDFASAFAEALGAADQLWLCDIYGARETPDPAVTADLIARELPAGRLAWRGARDAVVAPLAEAVRAGDVVLTVGAGDVTAVGPALLARLGASA